MADPSLFATIRLEVYQTRSDVSGGEPVRVLELAAAALPALLDPIDLGDGVERVAHAVRWRLDHPASPARLMAVVCVAPRAVPVRGGLGRPG